MTEMCLVSCACVKALGCFPCVGNNYGERLLFYARALIHKVHKQQVMGGRLPPETASTIIHNTSID